MNFLKRYKRQIDVAAFIAREAILPLIGLFLACCGLANWTLPPFIGMLLIVLTAVSTGLQVVRDFLRIPPLPLEMMLFLDGDVDFFDTRQYAG
jgi:hypothetical protein